MSDSGYVGAESRQIMDHNLVKSLDECGKQTQSMRFADGTELLVLPYGGRMLGLFAAGDARNFLWTQPALSSVGTARSYYERDEWHNSGGERLWLSPEVFLFFPRHPDRSVYVQPPGFDPGDYSIQSRDGTVRLASRGRARHYGSGRDITFELTREFSPAPNPLRLSGDEEARLAYAGYTQRSSLRLPDGSQDVLGMWNLLQLPHGGELLVSTRARSEPRVYFGSVPAGDIEVSGRLIRYQMRGSAIGKIGIRAESATGRIGYLWPAGDEWSLVVRNCLVDPSGNYVDVPPDDLSDFGYAIQACCVVDDQLGRFCEMEYHAPAIGGPSGRKQCWDESQVWAFRGSQSAIRAAARTLISSEA